VFCLQRSVFTIFRESTETEAVLEEEREERQKERKSERVKRMLKPRGFFAEKSLLDFSGNDRNG
jgi:hypothetical protein